MLSAHYVGHEAQVLFTLPLSPLRFPSPSSPEWSEPMSVAAVDLHEQSYVHYKEMNWDAHSEIAKLERGMIKHLNERPETHIYLHKCGRVETHLFAPWIWVELMTDHRVNPSCIKFQIFKVPRQKTATNLAVCMYVSARTQSFFPPCCLL